MPPKRSRTTRVDVRKEKGSKKEVRARGFEEERALQLSVGCEAKVRQLLKTLCIAEDVDVALHGSSKDALEDDTKERMRKTYDELRRSGFDHDIVSMSFRSLPVERCTKDATIDWMLLHAPTESLPERYRGGRGASEKKGDVKVVSMQEWSQGMQASRVESLEMEEVAMTKDVASKETTKETVDKKPLQAIDQEEAQWILRYLEEASSEDELEDTSHLELVEERPSPCGIQRPPPASREEALEQMEEARSMAKKAKQEGNQQAQRQASDWLRQLAAALREMPSPPSSEGKASEGSDTFDEHERIDTKVEEEEDEEPVMSLFDEDEAESWGEPTEQPITLEDLQPAPSDLQARSKKVKPKPTSKSNAPIQTLPKALLQQHCSREGISPPKFSKVSGVQGGFRYTVTLERVPSKAGGRRARRRDMGPMTFGDEEDAGTYSTIQDAQNAAATRALFALCSERPIHQILPLPFAELWVALLNHKITQKEVPMHDDEESVAYTTLRDELITSVLNEAIDSERWTDRSLERMSSDEPDLLENMKQMEEVGRAFTEEEIDKMDQESVELKKEYKEWSRRMAGSKMQLFRSRLPVAQIKDDLLRALEEHDSVIVCGDTGCGKTTQIPQFIFDSAAETGKGGWCNLICTQPRRVAAISLAERVAEEREGPPPGKSKCRIGYAVRLEHSATSHTRILYCTTGILLRRLLADPGLHGVSHVILDEIHERSMQGDFLLSLLRRLQNARKRVEGQPPLKLVLMSATIDPTLFSEYLGDCPVLEAQGRTFPVKQMFLEDIYEMLEYQLPSDSWAALRPSRGSGRQAHKKAISQSKQHIVATGWGDEDADSSRQILNPLYDPIAYDGLRKSTKRSLAIVDESKVDYELIEALLEYIDETGGEGAILVFLPGLAEIRALKSRLLASRRFSESSGNHLLLALHSTLPAEEQRRVFRRPPKGTRKIVLSTNIAETSVTIDDIVFVVDCGRMREMRMDNKRGMSCLTEVWAPKASLRQRKGRAGRVQEGYCYTLLTRARIESLPEHAVPEIARASLVDLVLQIKLMHLGNAVNFLSQCPQPPPLAAVEAAVRTLHEVGALDQMEGLTPLGQHLAKLPVDPRIGKLLIIGSALGTLSAALTIGACLTYKSPFLVPSDATEAAERVHMTFIAPKAKTKAAGSESDHLAMVAAYEGWAKAKRGGVHAAYKFAREHYLSVEALQMIQELREQFSSLLMDVGFCDTTGHTPAGSSKKKHLRWYDDDASPWNRNDSCAPVVKAVLCGALLPNVATYDRSTKRWSDGIQDVAIHPSSLLHPTKYNTYKHNYLVFHEKMKTSKVYLCDCTLVSPMAILLLGSSNLEVDHKAGTIRTLDRITIKAPAQVAVMVRQMRYALDTQLRAKIDNPAYNVANDPHAAQVVSTIVLLLCDHDLK